MPKVELLAVGTELLLGQLVDTNTHFVAQALAGVGIDVYGTHTVGDNRVRIAETMRAALERADGVISTGGLGPTIDDLTKEAVCDALGIGTVLHEPSLAQMQGFFDAIGREMRDNNRKQAEIPVGAHVLTNPRGTAPGFVAFGRDDRFIACMPGVPREMRPMLTELLVPFLRERFALREAIHTRVVHTIGLGESELDHRIKDVFLAGENPKIAVLAHEGRCDVKLMAKARSREVAEEMIEPIEAEIRARLEGYVYGSDGATVQDAIHALLQARGQFVATAESCTGGRIAAALAQTPGASRSFRGGIVAYDNAVKVHDLGVKETTLATFGAVSVEAAGEMARGALVRLNADVAIADTGIAGPDGGTPAKPVGLVCFAIESADGPSKTWKFNFLGDRDSVTRRASVMALGLLWRWLRM